jgi:aconitate hydratase
MGVMPLEFLPGESADDARLSPAARRYDVEGIADGLAAAEAASRCSARADDGTCASSTAIARVDTPDDVEYYRHGGLLPYVLRGMLRATQ